MCNAILSVLSVHQYKCTDECFKLARVHTGRLGALINCWRGRGAAASQMLNRAGRFRLRAHAAGPRRRRTLTGRS